MATKCRALGPKEKPNARLLSALIVRSPYERLLSAYLGQVAAPLDGHPRDSSAPSQLQLSFAPGDKMGNSLYGQWQATPEGFADFVRKLTKRSEEGKPIGNVFAVDHLAPIIALSSHPRNCLAHSSGRAPLAARYVVLKLELQSEWYASWVREAGLERYVVDTRWPNGCWWRPPNRTCAESLEAPKSEGLQGGGAQGRCDRGSIAGGTHNTGSCRLMSRYFTPELAGLVTRYAAADLAAFRYPQWEPSTQQPLPPVGPSLHKDPTMGRAFCICGLGNITF